VSGACESLCHCPLCMCNNSVNSDAGAMGTMRLFYSQILLLIAIHLFMTWRYAGALLELNDPLIYIGRPKGLGEGYFRKVSGVELFCFETFNMESGIYGQFHVVDITEFQSRDAPYIKELIFSTVCGACHATSPFSEIRFFFSFSYRTRNSPSTPYIAPRLVALHPAKPSPTRGFPALQRGGGQQGSLHFLVTFPVSVYVFPSRVGKATDRDPPSKGGLNYAKELRQQDVTRDDPHLVVDVQGPSLSSSSSDPTPNKPRESAAEIGNQGGSVLVPARWDH
jgi:hypothetical protein